MNKILNYIIGDIHGCYEELLELEKLIMEHSHNQKAIPFIISCGDLIDRGPYSKEVVNHFIKGENNKTHIAIMGNHELMILQALENISPSNNPIIFPIYFETYKQIFELNKSYFPETTFEKHIETMIDIWLQAGGKETLKNFGLEKLSLSESKISTEMIDYLLNMPLYFEGDNFFVTHAIPYKNDLVTIKLFENNNSELIELKKSVNNILWNRKIPEEKINDKLNISGHSPFKNVKILNSQNAIQIDTGCVYGNKLTAYCPETNSFIYTYAKKQYREKILKE